MKEQIHIGKIIQAKVEEKNLSIVSFARMLSCSRTNVYKIFERTSIDTNLLERISKVLNYDFFLEYSQNIIEREQNVPR